LSARFALLVTAPPPVASLPFLDALFACLRQFQGSTTLSVALVPAGMVSNVFSSR
jgi:hypothetical protein